MSKVSYFFHNHPVPAILIQIQVTFKGDTLKDPLYLILISTLIFTYAHISFLYKSKFSFNLFTETQSPVLSKNSCNSGQISYLIPKLCF